MDRNYARSMMLLLVWFAIASRQDISVWWGLGLLPLFIGCYLFINRKRENDE